VSILGNRVVRLEDPRFLRGNGLYVENLELEGALSVTFVRSPLAHARVTSVDASAALERPDVQVFTGADVDAHPFGPPPHWHITAGMARPLVARDVARFAGDIVAVVVAGDRASAVDAAELVLVDYDPLPAVLSIEEAAKDEILLFPELGSNVANHGGAEELDDALFEGCEVVVSDVLVSQRLVAAPLEPRSAAAVMGEDGRLTLWATSQTPHMGKMVTAGLLGLEPSDVRVVSPDVGGGFGAKMVEPEAVLVAWVERRQGRPARWTERRSEKKV
jgi:carbon-monoxide dehydrogenase large subunit